MKSPHWITPKEIIDDLGPFDLDPCAADPQPWLCAAENWRSHGLDRTWRGRVWLNPPYSREAVRWLERIAGHGYGTALVFARTETRWFCRTVWEAASAVLFFYGRLHFHYPSGERSPANAGAPSVLVAYGDYDSLRLRKSGLSGKYIDLGTPADD